MDNVLIPNFIHNKGLTCTEKMVFAYIYKRIGNPETPDVAINTRDLSKFVELSGDAVTAITRKLESQGWIARKIVWKPDRETGKQKKLILYSLPLFQHPLYENTSTQNIELHSDEQPSPEKQTAKSKSEGATLFDAIPT